MSDTSDQTPQEVFVADPTKHAFVTMVICGDSYAIGAMTLAHSIKKHGSTASCVVLVSSDVSDTAKQQLKKVFTEVVVVPVFDVKVPTVKGETEDKMKLYTHAFTKLHALKLVQYEKICLLDADSICVSNPDSIFQVQTPAGICSGIKNDNTHHGKPIDYKIIEKCYKEAGFPGNTYLLRPSISDFDRAVKALAIKVKVTQVSIVQTKGAIPKSKVTGKSAFAGFDDDDDNDENPEDDADEAIIQQAPREDIVKTTKFLTKEDLEMTRFEDDKAEKKKVYPYEIFESPDVAPLGFSYDGKKSNMNQDERLIVDLYLKQWKHLHQRFGFLSWKKPSKNALPPIFLHFTQKPWAVQTEGQDVSRWADLVYFDFAAIDLYKAFSNDKDAVEFIRKSFPAIDTKVQQQADGTLVLPVQPEPEVKPTTTTTTTTPTTTTTTTTTTTSTIPTPTTTTTTTTTGTTAAVPKQSAWKKA